MVVALKTGLPVMYWRGAGGTSHNLISGDGAPFLQCRVGGPVIFGDRRTCCGVFYAVVRELSRDFSYLTCHSARCRICELWYRVVQRRYYTRLAHTESAGWVA